jgi:hypothetical protein
MEIEAAERLELLKQANPQIVGQELAEGDEEATAPNQQQILLSTLQTVQQLAQTLASPKVAIRDESGRLIGVQHQQPGMQ